MQCHSSKQQLQARAQGGSILPLVAFSLVFIFAFLAFALDVMREVLEIQQLRFAARAAALDVFTCAALDPNGQAQNNPICNPDGSFVAQAMTEMQTELGRPNGGSSGTTWNQAIGNPSARPGQSWLTDVNLQGIDLRSGATQGNLIDKDDPLLQLSARRSDNEALNLFFLPVQYAANLMTGGSAIPASSRKNSLVQTIEIAGQPATRIGAGAPLGQASGRAQIFARGRFAAFPLAINYDDFKRLLASVNVSPLTSVVHVSDPGAVQLPTIKDLRAYFINLKSGGPVSGYYWDAQNPSRLSDLIGLMQYFDAVPQVSEETLPPAAIECSVQIDRFSKAVYAGNPDLATVISQLPLNRCYIVPVVTEGKSPASQCQVLGFALLNLTAVTPANGSWNFQFKIGESLPVPNAACGSGLRTVPAFDGTSLAALPEAQGPFAPRKFDPSTNTLAARALGVVLAATVSPRRINTQN